MVVHTYKPNTKEAEAGGSTGHSWLRRGLSKNKQTNNNKNNPPKTKSHSKFNVTGPQRTRLTDTPLANKRANKRGLSHCVRILPGFK